MSIASRPALRLSALLLLAALVVGVLLTRDDGPARSATAQAAAPAALKWRNPVIAADFPDPSVVRDGDVFWATSTASASAPGFALMRSTDLVHWTPAGTIFPRLPTWASGSFWAPELFIDGTGVRAYYSARKRGGRLCVAVATAPAVAGPYTDHGPLVCQRAGSIDPTRTIDRYGRPFLVWKEDGNAVRRPSTIWRQRLTPDGLRLLGRPRPMLVSAQRWEAGVVEAPSIVVHGGWTYLFYSGNAYGSSSCGYALGVARARTLQGRFHRAPTNPILRSSAAWRCPGHASFITDAAGRSLVMYHAYRATEPPQGSRYGLLDQVRWGADGWPTVAAGRAPSVVARAF